MLNFVTLLSACTHPFSSQSLGKATVSNLDPQLMVLPMTSGMTGQGISFILVLPIQQFSLRSGSRWRSMPLMQFDILIMSPDLQSWHPDSRHGFHGESMQALHGMFRWLHSAQSGDRLRLPTATATRPRRSKLRGKALLDWGPINGVDLGGL
ncbi:hypothetical protein J7T55_001180 [Diaporthe amygdali]|uniref:uncharacterized protein n=1 Tax=Phomopsis amygdali TaxID=1214568 RepID=UPI0022FDBB8C|nr:uncharacterized protein J7T55_001180 [Diaporthe amygdali]KAJ0120322.1 hypothetical protein J7T55_001180 [Diaporthe amygdali]